MRSRVTAGNALIAYLVRLIEDYEDGDEEPLVQSEYGLSLWSRVATAANTLTVNVSKAWTSNITTHSGERASLSI